jgi:hypothetical protein
MINDPYKLLHLLGLFLVFAALGAATLRGRDEGKSKEKSILGMSHGIGLLLLLVSGFGMIAKYDLGFGAWAWGKVILWLLMGAWLVVVRRVSNAWGILWWVLPFLGLLGAYLALFLRPVA